MQTSTKCYILVAVVVVLGCVYGGLYWWACEHPLTPLAEKMLSPEKRAEKIVASIVSRHLHWDGEATPEGVTASEALVNIGAPAVPALIECLSDGDDTPYDDQDDAVRIWAPSVLGEIGDTSAAPLLIGLLRDRNYIVRVVAAGALGKIGDPSAIPGLEMLLNDSDEAKGVRWSAVVALDRIDDPLAVPALLKAVTGETDSEVRNVAQKALDRLRAPQGEAPTN